VAVVEDLDLDLPRPGLDRCELYRLLSEPVRLRLLALAAEEELAVGELAELLAEAQPNVSRHAAPLRKRGLLVERKQGTRVLVRLAQGAAKDAVVADALAAGRALCVEDGSLARIVEVVRARDAAARAFFGRDQGRPSFAAIPGELPRYLAALAPLLPRRALAVDAGTGDGSLLDVLCPVFERVIAIDRERAQLDRCRARVEQRGFHNAELVEGELESEPVRRAIDAHGGADVIFGVRLLHHAARPQETMRALAALARPGGAVVVLDYAHHDDESMRAQADLWLGFEPAELRRFARAAGLEDVVVTSVPDFAPGAGAPDHHLPWQVFAARRPARGEGRAPDRDSHASHDSHASQKPQKRNLRS
jgi:ArsR family transcriptional regulator